MPDLTRLEWARLNLEQVRAQLIDAAAFGKRLPPEQLERAAEKIAESLRVFAEETRGGQRAVGPPHMGCLDYRGKRR
ncbi:DUF6374 family protein [Nocardia terpenica]|uniref:Uncharacterized protein n=1 Tax=Nocardia terpenica TaxID=455432 RepID=A0A6G9ZB24_9NOCA|nr:DUF6374 family protein [Nocardia terpenica]QIS22213.1 hypothetical protein F6W96_31590 [Nocardia terpenica]